MKTNSAFLFLIIIFIIMPCLSIDHCKETHQLEPSFILRVIVNKIDWTRLEADVKIRVTINSLPYNSSSIGCIVHNHYDYMINNKKRRIYGGTIQITINQTYHWTYNGKTYYRYSGEKSGKLRLFGRPEFYPYDSYMVNLTFAIPYFGMKDESLFSVDSYFDNESWFQETVPPKISFRDWAHINYKIYFRRQPYTFWYLEMILSFAFLFLGGVFVIDAYELRHRLNIIIPLSIFVATFYFKVPLPHRTGMTFYEIMLFILFFAISIVGFISILVYALIKKFECANEVGYFLDSLILLITIGFVYIIHGQFVVTTKYYPWVAIPNFYNYYMTLSAGFIFRLSISAIHSKRKEIKDLLSNLKSKAKKIRDILRGA